MFENNLPANFLCFIDEEEVDFGFLPINAFTIITSPVSNYLF